ncbi:MAG TPA: Hpt domain-containing protein [Bacteriovoracaceae bacterium]|nr:Hpt domain-containing protein [Bacteriovoracaceae bacterium]
MKLPIELKRRYLDRRLEDIKVVRQMIDHGDFSEAIRVGHQVKGNAVTFEVPQIAWLGTEIESAAKRRDAEKIRILMQRMEVVIKGVVCDS